VPVVGTQVVKAGMHGSRHLSDVPGDGIISRVRAIPENVLKGRARSVNVEAVAEGGGHRLLVN